MASREVYWALDVKKIWKKRYVKVVVFDVVIPSSKVTIQLLETYTFEMRVNDLNILPHGFNSWAYV